jgi:YgiT-type zinc finger domain-containing protein
MSMSTASFAATNQKQDPSMDTTVEAYASCSQCGGHDFKATDVRSAFWEGDRLVVIEDIPAIICANCGEQHYDDATVVLIDLLRGDGFPTEKARRQISVPVFSLRDRLKGGAES